MGKLVFPRFQNNKFVIIIVLLLGQWMHLLPLYSPQQVYISNSEAIQFSTVAIS